MSKAVHSCRIVDQITTKTDKRFEPVARMADVIVEMILETGNCEQQDLLAEGFPRQDIATLWHFANALAAIEIRCRANGIGFSCEREARYA